MNPDDELDPVYRHARREAGMVIALFTLALAWSIGNYYFTGYIEPASARESLTHMLGIPTMENRVEMAEDTRFHEVQVSTLWGMPTWVVTGILLPWLVIDLVAFWFCFYYMADDDLGPNPEDTDPKEHVPKDSRVASPPS